MQGNSTRVFAAAAEHSTLTVGEADEGGHHARALSSPYVGAVMSAAGGLGPTKTAQAAQLNSRTQQQQPMHHHQQQQSAQAAPSSPQKVRSLSQCP
jgi:hypothetical protein